MTMSISRQDVFKLFFDSRTVSDPIQRSSIRQLNRVGGLTRTIARRSIRKRKRPSAPGNPPSSRQGGLRNNIFFVVDARRLEVMAGPVKLRSRVGYVVPGTLEEGRQVKTRRRINGSTRFYLLNFQPRPFMGPAHRKAAVKFPAMFADSL